MEQTIFKPRLKFKPPLKFFEFGHWSISIRFMDNLTFTTSLYEFNEFKPRLKLPKKPVSIELGLNIEKLN